jgi:hypothetical protein
MVETERFPATLDSNAQSRSFLVDYPDTRSSSFLLSNLNYRPKTREAQELHSDLWREFLDEFAEMSARRAVEKRMSGSGAGSELPVIRPEPLCSRTELVLHQLDRPQQARCRRHCGTTAASAGTSGRSSSSRRSRSRRTRSTCSTDRSSPSACPSRSNGIATQG